MCGWCLWTEVFLSSLLWCHLIVQFFLLVDSRWWEQGAWHISLGTLALLLERIERLLELAFIFCLRICKHHINPWDVCFELMGLKGSFRQLGQGIGVCKEVYHFFFCLFHCLSMLQVEVSKVEFEVMQLWIELFWRKIWHFWAPIYLRRWHEVIICCSHLDLIVTHHLGLHRICTLLTLIVKGHWRPLILLFCHLFPVLSDLLPLFCTHWIW